MGWAKGKKINGDYELFDVDISKDRAVIWEKENSVEGGDLEVKIKFWFWMQ